MSIDLAANGMVGLTRDALVTLRSVLFRDAGANAAAYLQEAGYAGGSALYQAFAQYWLGREATGDELATRVGVVLSLPFDGALRHHKSRFLAEDGGGFWIETADDLKLIDSNAAYLLLAAVILIDACLLYRFFSVDHDAYVEASAGFAPPDVAKQTSTVPYP